MSASTFELMISATKRLCRRKWVGYPLLVITALTSITTAGLCQSQDTKDAMAEAARVNKKLDMVVQQITQQFKGNANLKLKLQAAQKAWSDYSDAYLDSIFPSPNHFDDYGSIYTLCCIYRTTDNTNTRIAQLKKYLLGAKPTATAADYQRVDKKLNDTWNSVLKIYPAEYVDVLRKAELKWIKFRDADADAFSETGSASSKPGLKMQRLVELEKQRVKELKQWIDGTEEGDMCAGSIPRTQGSGSQ